MIETREPGGTPLGEELRAILLTRQDLGVVWRTEALLMCAARAQLVETVIRPALEVGRTVVCDRFAGSTLAYQGYGRGLSVRDLSDVVRFATDALEPDLVVLVDVPVEDGLARKRQQQAGRPEEWNRFEDERRAFHERVRAGYLELAAESPERWRTVDGRGSLEAVAENVWSAVHAALRQ